MKMLVDSTDHQVHELVETSDLSLYADRKLQRQRISKAK